MLAVKRSAGVTTGKSEESIVYRQENIVSQGIGPGFETQGRCHQKSKTGLSVAPQKGLISKTKKTLVRLQVIIFSDIRASCFKPDMTDVMLF